MRKVIFFSTIVILAFITGIVFLIRSSLSKYDEYTIKGSVHVFRQSKASIVVYIKDHLDVFFFSQEGAITNIGGNHYYYLETCDALTLDLLKRTKLEGKNADYPEILGNTGEVVWIYDKQLKAFDPFNHALVCDENKLVQQNPDLLNILPDEIKYYTFNYITNRLEVFTKIASRFSIGNDFTAIPIEEEMDKGQTEITQLRAKLKQFENFQKSENNYKSKLLWRDSIWEMRSRLRVLEDEYNDQQEFLKRLNEMQNQQFTSVNELIINATLKDSTVYALITRKETDTINTTFTFQRYFSAEEQRYFCKAYIKEISKSRGLYNSLKIGKWTSLAPARYFLKGNFLLNKQTLQPIVLHDPESWLVISVKEIGQNSPLLLHRVNTDGNIQWAKELPINIFNDLLFIPDKAIIFCAKPAINEGNKSDMLLTVDLQTGNYQMMNIKP
jgi:hypothetical protein